MVVTQLDNPNSPNGKYSGYGVIGIPFLMNMPLIGKFSNITVNEAMEVVEGKVEITTTGIDAWLQQWQPPPGWNETDNLHYNGSISNVTSDTGTIFINGQAFGNTGGNTLITDNNGNTYYVSADGSISTPEGPLEAPVSDTITSIPDSLPNIVFTDGSDAQFAFDSKEVSSQTAGKNYDILKKGSETYPVACKLLQTGAQDNLTATLGTAAQEINTNSLVFKRNDGTLVPSTNSGNTYQITVKGKLNLFADALWAFAKKKNNTDTTMYPLGKINLISVDKKKKKIVIIPVNSIGLNTDAASLQTQINAIYEKVAVEWEVTKALDLQVPGYTSDSLLNVTRSALNVTYGADLRKIINAYKAVDLSIDENTAYLFLVNKASNNDLGYMALNKKFGFIFSDNNTNVAHTVAHEIGHGNLVLKHPFTGETGGNTQNLMDYNSGELFNLQQFRIIHDPSIQQNFLSTLVQDEDAGAMVDNREQIIEFLAKIKSAYKRDMDLSIIEYKPWLTDFFSIGYNLKINGILYKSISISIRWDEDGLSEIIHPKNAVEIITGDYINIYNRIKIKVTPANQLTTLQQLTILKVYLENLLPSKNLLLFVNGYDPTKSLTDNKIHTIDPMNYWGGIAQSFIAQIGTKNIVYANGNMSISTSNHLEIPRFATSLGTSQSALGAKILPSCFLPLSLQPMYQAVPITDNPCYHNASCVILNTLANTGGFAQRKAAGRTAATAMGEKISKGELIFDAAADTIDIVCHSMGFAYAQGMVEVFKQLNFKLGSYYIIAPENGCSGSVTLTDFKGDVWQYGSNDNQQGGDPLWIQDGVAPQCAVGNLDNNRAYIPNSSPKGFTESHSIKNYGWIFNTILNGQNGYVKKRN